MSSHTGLLLLPGDVPIAAAGRQPFTDLQRRLSPCGQVRAFCMTTQLQPVTTDRFPRPQPAPLWYCVSFLEWNGITETVIQLENMHPAEVSLGKSLDPYQLSS